MDSLEGVSREQNALEIFNNSKCTSLNVTSEDSAAPRHPPLTSSKSSALGPCVILKEAQEDGVKVLPCPMVSAPVINGT